MIEVILPVSNQTQAEYFINKSGSHFCVSTVFLSSGLEHTSDLETIAQIYQVCHGASAKLGILINRLILESEFESFIQEFKAVLAVFTPDFVIVSDVGVMFYLQQHYQIPIYFHSDTTIANANDGQVLIDEGVSLIMPARELTLAKQVALTQALKEHIMLPIFGYQIMSKSYRPLLSNYYKQINQPVPSKYQKFYFKENKRDEYYLGFEDDHGFSMFSHAIIDMIQEKPQLEAAGLKYGWIDTNFIEDEIIGAVIQYFHDYIRKDDLEEFISQYQDHHQFSKGLHYQDTSLTKEAINE